MTRPKLILHIGFGKCGSTALQRFMLGAQDQLRAQGVVLVDETLGHPGRGRAKSVAQTPLSALLTQVGARRQITTALRSVARKMEEHGDTAAILSCESLSNASEYAELFGSLHGAFDIRVLAYVRPQEDLLPSYWKQSGLVHGRSLDEFIALRMRQGDPNYWHRLNAWMALVGHGRVSVGSLRRTALKNGDLIEDFCHRLDLPFDMLRDAIPTAQANPSFDHHILTVLQQAPHVLGGQNLGLLFNYFEETLPQSAFEHGRNPLTQEQRAQIHAHYETQNRMLVKRFMPGLSYEDAFGTNPDIREKDVSDDLLHATTQALTYSFYLLQQQNQLSSSLRNRNRIRTLEQAIEQLQNEKAVK